MLVVIASKSFSQRIQNHYSPELYANLQLLEASGLIPQGSTAQRPLSEKKIEELLCKTEQVADSLQYVVDLVKSSRKLLVKNSKESNANFEINLLQKVTISNVLTNQDGSSIQQNGLSGVDAVIQPLLIDREGRFYNETSNTYLETLHSFSYKDKVSVQVQPQIVTSRSNTTQHLLRFQKLLFKVNLGFAEVSVGRDNVLWGIRNNGGLLFSENARPLDMIKLSSHGQNQLPWFLKNAGTYSFSTFVAGMGKHYSRKNATLAAYRFDYQPTEKWNIGIEHTVVIGGEGLDQPSVGRAVGEYIGFLIKPGDPAPSNHNITVTILKNFKTFNAYFGVMLEDTDYNLEMQFVHNGTWLFGYHNPNLGQNGKLSLRSEIINSSPRAYRHGIYRSGHAINQRILGFGLGPDVLQSTTTLDFLNDNNGRFSLNFQYINRSGNSYRVIKKGNGDFIDLEVIESRPSENHLIFMTNWSKTITKQLNFKIQAGLDYTRNKDFVAKSNTLDYMVDFSIEFFPGI